MLPVSHVKGMLSVINILLGSLTGYDPPLGHMSQLQVGVRLDDTLDRLLVMLIISRVVTKLLGCQGAFSLGKRRTVKIDDVWSFMVFPT
jgi:hypothetical protein